MLPNVPNNQMHHIYLGEAAAIERIGELIRNGSPDPEPIEYGSIEYRPKD